MVRMLQAILPQLHGELKINLLIQKSVLGDPVLERSHQEKMISEI